MVSNGHTPHPSSLRLGLATHQPPWRHHAQSLLGPSFHNPRTPHVLESHLERAAPFSRRDDDRLSALPPPLHCASILQPATPDVVAFKSWNISAPICLNRLTLMIMIAFITFNSSNWVPLIKGLNSSNPWESECLGFDWNQTEQTKYWLSITLTKWAMFAREVFKEQIKKNPYLNLCGGDCRKPTL